MAPKQRPDRCLDRQARVKQVQRRAQQDLRDEERREKKCLDRFATKKTKAHQAQGGAGAEHSCEYRRKQAYRETHPEESRDKSLAREKRLKPVQGQTAWWELESGAW